MSAAKAWDYGGASRRIDMRGEIILPNDSRVQVCDWKTGIMPSFMRDADTLFVDPPWNNGNRNSFQTKADLPPVDDDFFQFTAALFSRIEQIFPSHLFLEMGKENLDIYLQGCKKLYRHVTFYNSIYYKKQSNKCYVIHATNDFKTRRYKELEDMPQSLIVRWLCEHHRFDCIGDLCMGRGLVGREAYRVGKSFVGTELNPKRLAVLVEWIKTQEETRNAAKAN